jgi:hypothetical protein
VARWNTLAVMIAGIVNLMYYSWLDPKPVSLGVGIFCLFVATWLLILENRRV